eukprot:jgi/Mesvir1/24124/Mv10841-RA.1
MSCLEDKENVAPSSEESEEESESEGESEEEPDAFEGMLTLGGVHPGRLNKGPAPSRVLVPREWIDNVNVLRFRVFKVENDLMESKGKIKKDKEAARKRFSRAIKKSEKMAAQQAELLREKEAQLQEKETQLREHQAREEKLRQRVSAMETEMVNLKQQMRNK